MEFVFLLFIFNILLIFIGLIRPSWLLFWNEASLRTRKKVLSVYGSSFILLSALLFAYANIYSMSFDLVPMALGFLASFICFLSMVLLIIGLLKPTSVIKWGEVASRSRRKVLAIYGSCFVLFLVGMMISKNEELKRHQVAPEVMFAQYNEMMELMKQADQLRSEQAKHPNWNINDPDVFHNGNIPLGYQYLETMGDISKQAVTKIDAGLVFKAPWKYYGQAISFSGVVKIVQDFPPNSRFHSEMVISALDGTIVDVLSTVTSGDIRVGQKVSFLAYPVGLAQVENQLGGKTTQLAVVTNRLN